jgi:hypothetical protein
MAATNISSKRVQISKANARIVATVSIAAFITAFCIVASKSLLSQRAYQSKVINEKEKALHQLDANIKAVDSLVASYGQFVSSPLNVLGGNPIGQGEKDGDNAKIVLDALPSKYDFPAVATSMDKLITGAGFKISGLSGTDDEIAQQNAVSGTPQPQEIPVTFSADGTYKALPALLDVLDRSIRPIHVQTINISGTTDQLKLNITAKTYYQPAKLHKITKKEVK